MGGAKVFLAQEISIPKLRYIFIEPSTFDVAERCKRINVFKVGKLWVFEHFFSEIENHFRQFAYNYNWDKYGFEFMTTGERDQA